MGTTKINDYKRMDAFSKELIKRDTSLAMLELRTRRLENITLDTEILKRVDNIMDRTFRMSAVYFLSIVKLEYPDLYKKSVSSVTPYFSINKGDQLVVSARRAYYYLHKIGKIDEILKDLKFPIILDEYTLWDMYSKKRVITNLFKLIRAVKPPQASFLNAVDFELTQNKIEKELINNAKVGNYQDESGNYESDFGNYQNDSGNYEAESGNYQQDHYGNTNTEDDNLVITKDVNSKKEVDTKKKIFVIDKELEEEYD